MAKAKTNKNKGVTKAPPSSVALTDEQREKYLKMGGAGLESATSKDFQIPMLYIGQKLSAAIDEEEDSYIKGCVEGDIYNTVSRGIVYVAKDDRPLPFIPCHFRVRVLEWAPDRGGLVAIHDDRLILTTADGVDDKGKPTLNDNSLVETAEYVGFIQLENGRWQQVMIPMSSSNMRCSRTLNTMISEYKPDWWTVEGAAPPSFMRQYLLTTERREKGENKWRAFTVVPGDESPGDLLPRAEKLYELAHNDLLEGVGREEEVGGGSSSGGGPAPGADTDVL